ncbi:hypothetical protein ACGH2B_09565 [Streptomyces sp. BBFR2]|uniref:hypothetical protein n=1 Tax=Streptomyces sp. BBFR2 TaxID=3372854 RepID=UPI0037D9CF96
MAMQDDGAVDVRPDPDPARADPAHRGRYRAAGTCLGLLGLAMACWTVAGVVQGGGGLWDFVEGLFHPALPGAVPVLGPYEWAFTAAFLAVAGPALAGRRAARAAALLLGWVLLAAAVREGVGLCDAAYRTRYVTATDWGWLLATRCLGLVTALVVLGALLPLGDGRRGAPGGPGAPGGAWRRRPSRICGVLFLLMGVVQLAWTVRGPVLASGHAGRFLRAVVDASVPGMPGLAAAPEFASAGAVLVLLTLGALAWGARWEVRSALLAYGAVQLYLTVRSVVELAVTDYFNRSLETSQGVLWLVTTAYGLAAMTSVVVLASARPGGPYCGARGEGLRTAAAGR